MKSLIIITLTIQFLCSIYSKSKCQNANDTILIELNNNTKIAFITDKIQDIKAIEKISIDSLIREINKSIESGKEDSIIKIEKIDTITSDNVYDSIKKPNDVMELTAGIGISTIKNSFATSFEPTLTVKLFNYYYSLTSSFDYAFKTNSENKLKMYINIFGGLEFGIRDKSENKGFISETKFNGIGIMYLLRPKGDFYGSNTFKLYISTGNGVINVKPQIVFTDNFKTIYPGVCINF